jgi:hypothetical protein
MWCCATHVVRGAPAQGVLMSPMAFQADLACCEPKKIHQAPVEAAATDRPGPNRMWLQPLLLVAAASTGASAGAGALLLVGAAAGPP